MWKFLIEFFYGKKVYVFECPICGSDIKQLQNKCKVCKNKIDWTNE